MARHVLMLRDVSRNFLCSELLSIAAEQEDAAGSVAQFAATRGHRGVQHDSGRR